LSKQRDDDDDDVDGGATRGKSGQMSHYLLHLLSPLFDFSEHGNEEVVDCGATVERIS
jgi:hypothetical protein